MNKVLFVASECYPLVKTGGLADVIGALPLALAGEGVDARVLLPAYPEVCERLKEAEALPLPGGKVLGQDGRLLAATTEEGLKVWALDVPAFFARVGNPYVGPNGHDWPDNHLRFAALSRVAADIAARGVGRWRPQLLHIHDWQAGLVPAYLSADEIDLPTLFTIHNIAFQGVFPAAEITRLGLPGRYYHRDLTEFWGQISFLKAGIAMSSKVSTVSPTYARELESPEFGWGLDGLIRHRQADMCGILNGIDAGVWDPANDPLIAAPYSAEKSAGKARNKEALQERLGLENDPNAPLLCVVSRLTQQKGMDLLLENLPQLLWRGGQLAVLGSGEAHLEAGFREAAFNNPGRVATVIGYNEPLSHLLQAGADAIVIPSRYEPCGLTQLYGLRYGTLPIVARTGGLADTIIDANAAAVQAGTATGFQFAPVTPEGLRHTLDRAFDLWADRKAWRVARRAAMQSDFGWSASARLYRNLYRRMLKDARQKKMGETR
ncbi:glycogen synthase GlgA [Afifella sp. JA880]|uniref:glycogen synthase GlgA n=1 Tax=Afifella sp. JA880 TaxID=2975280 RepID=UPI0021BA92BF|nr:glycogen synthase GlgA [Afifella sp. JA880]MCT8268839.1 glycogen synthase GlgA [Afifella sp. JA880]